MEHVEEDGDMFCPPVASDIYEPDDSADARAHEIVDGMLIAARSAAKRETLMNQTEFSTYMRGASEWSDLLTALAAAYLMERDTKSDL